MTTNDSLPYPRAVPYLAIALTFAVNLAIPTWARALAALPLVLYLPGIALIAAALPRAPRTLDVQVLAVAMSLACAILLGVSLGLVGHLNTHGWEVGLCAIAIGGCVLSLRNVRRTKAASLWLEARSPRQVGLSPTSEADRQGRAVAPIELALFAVALAIATGAFLLARQGALAQPVAPYTDFWMIAEDADRPTLATVGFRNEEGRDTIYHVDILRRGQLVDEWPAVSLRAGATYSSKVAFDPGARKAPEGQRPKIVGPEASRVEARLYKNGEFGMIYRKAWVALPVLVVLPKMNQAERSTPAIDPRK